MSQAIAAFQNQLNDLLISLNLNDFEFAPEQDYLSLLFDERFAVHFSLVSNEMWTIEAELSPPSPCDDRRAEYALSLNAPSGQLNQPIIALNGDGQAFCWIGLPLQDVGPVARYEALDSVLAMANELSDPAPSRGPHAFTGAL